MKDRLLLFLNRENISATTLADEIGVQRSSISHILSGRNNPSYDFIQKLIKRYDSINTEWLLTGKGDMYKQERQVDDKKNEGEIDLTDEKNKEKDVSQPQLSFNSEALEQYSQSEKENAFRQVTNVNKIEKIVYFYKNGTFKEYNPSE